MCLEHSRINYIQRRIKMKKILSAFLVCVLLVGTVFALASCNISESYAEKINKAFDKGEPYTYEKVKKDLGEDAVDLTFLESGVIIAVKDCDSLDDIEDRLEEGKKVQGIVVTVAGGKAIAAKYGEITEDDLK